MKGVAYGIYSNKSRGLPMVILRSKWHAQAWVDGTGRVFGSRDRGTRYFIKRIWIERNDNLTVFHVSEDLGYKTKPFRKLNSLKEI